MAASLHTVRPPCAAWPKHKKQDRLPATILFANPNLPTSKQTNRRSGSPLRRKSIAPSAISGSSGNSTKMMSEDTTSLLEGVEVFDLAGKPFPITNLWKDRKAVIAFARHFGCVLCRKRADFLASKKDIMDAAGVTLVLIGPGSVDQAKAFSVQTKFQGEVYADPSYSSFKALSFVSGVSTTFTPLSGLKIIQSYMEGYRQDWGLSFQKDTISKGGCMHELWWLFPQAARRNSCCRTWCKQYLIHP